MTNKLKNEKTLIELAQEGDENAFEQLYDAYYERLINYSFRRVLDKGVADDVTANAFMIVARKIGQFEYRHVNSFSGWIFRIASNEVNQYLRKTNRYKSVDIDDYEQILPDERESIEKELGQKQEYVRVHKQIATLKPKHQTIIDLFYFEGMPHKDIAEVVQMSEGAVRTSLHRALNKLAKQLENDNLGKVII